MDNEVRSLHKKEIIGKNFDGNCLKRRDRLKLKGRITAREKSLYETDYVAYQSNL